MKIVPSDYEPLFLEGVFLWDERGYCFRARDDLSLLDEVKFGSGNVWLDIALALEAAKHGDLYLVPQILSVVARTSLSGVAQAGLSLIGDAGSRSTLGRLESALLNSSSYVRVKACCAMLHSGYLSLAESILRTWQTVPIRERSILSSYLSLLLESEFAEIATYEDFDNDDAYVARVKFQIEELIGRHGRDAVLFRGEPANMESLCNRILGLLDSGLPIGAIGIDAIQLRHRFEAQSGTDCSSFYVRGNFQPKTVRHVVQSFLSDSSNLSGFDSGARYFFGKRIPE